MAAVSAPSRIFKPGFELCSLCPFDIYKTEEGDGDLWRIYNREYDGNPEALPEKPRSSAVTRNCCFRADMPDTEREFSSEKERNAVNGGAQAQGRFIHCKKYENRRGNSCDTQKHGIMRILWRKVFCGQLQNTEEQKRFIVHRRRIYVEKAPMKFDKELLRVPY